MTGSSYLALRSAINDNLFGDLETPPIISVADTGWSSWFDVTGLSVATIGAACAEIAALKGEPIDRAIEIDHTLASIWFGLSLRPDGWALPPTWSDTSGVYQTADGTWIRLHTNAPHHRDAALGVLQCAATKDAVTTAVSSWSAVDLETAIVAAGGVAAELRSLEDWRSHPQGKAVSAEPLLAWEVAGEASNPAPLNPSGRPLSGLKVLDCTRILAGPSCTRFLAGYGSDVLRIDPPGWAEDNVVPEVTLGKRTATLDLKTTDGKQQFIQLLERADIFVHGYRPGALDGLGLGADDRRKLNRNLIEVTLNAYGWTGPWRARRGYDSLLQMSSGIAHLGMVRSGSDKPLPLPVPALDYGAGFLMAAAAVRAVRLRQQTGQVTTARTSLARVAAFLISTLKDELPENLRGETADDQNPSVEQTDWGPARRINWPALPPAIQPQWSLPARALHSDPPAW